MKFRRKKKDPQNRPHTRPMREPLPTEGLAGSVFLAYGIVLLNVLLVAGIGLLVLFFRGIVNYMTWIVIAGLLLILGAGYAFIRRMRRENASLKQMLALPEFSGRDVEISLLGGFAALRMGEKRNRDTPRNPSFLQLESPEDIRIRDLTELGRMYENALITREEYELAKRQIFKHAGKPVAAITEGRPMGEEDKIVDISPLTSEKETF